MMRTSSPSGIKNEWQAKDAMLHIECVACSKL